MPQPHGIQQALVWLSFHRQLRLIMGYLFGSSMLNEAGEVTRLTLWRNGHRSCSDSGAS